MLEKMHSFIQEINANFNAVQCQVIISMKCSQKNYVSSEMLSSTYIMMQQ